jgi:hypothetical protein
MVMESRGSTIIKAVQIRLKADKGEDVKTDDKFTSYMGVPPSELDRQELVCLCNMFYENIWNEKITKSTPY